MSLDEAKRQWRRSPIFRDPLFARAEMDDPVDGRPFVQHGRLEALEAKWFFKRDACPCWIRLFVGSVARRRVLLAVEEEYQLSPGERFQLIEESIQCVNYSALDPETWNVPFLCAVKIPAPEPIWWWGGRDIALSNPVIRDWYHNSLVVHGAEAFQIVQRERDKWM
jgi:hypothetical protein